MERSSMNLNAFRHVSPVATRPPDQSATGKQVSKTGVFHVRAILHPGIQLLEAD